MDDWGTDLAPSGHEVSRRLLVELDHLEVRPRLCQQQSRRLKILPVPGARQTFHEVSTVLSASF